MPDEITFGGSLKKADLAAAMRLHGGNASRRWQLGTYSTLATAFFVTAAVTEWILALLALFFAGIFILTFYGPRIAAHQQWKGYQTVREEMSGSAGAERVVFDYPGALAAQRPCTELVWTGFVADRGGDLATATQLSRRAFDLCPQLGFVRHFAAHTIQAYAGQIRQAEPERALGLLRRAQELDPYTPEIAAAVAELEGGG